MENDTTLIYSAVVIVIIVTNIEHLHHLSGIVAIEEGEKEKVNYEPILTCVGMITFEQLSNL